MVHLFVRVLVRVRGRVGSGEAGSHLLSPLAARPRAAEALFGAHLDALTTRARREHNPCRVQVLFREALLIGMYSSYRRRQSRPSANVGVKARNRELSFHPN